MLAGVAEEEGFVMQAVLVSPADAEMYPLGSDSEAQDERFGSLEKLRELLLRYEQSFADLKKIPAKRLKNGYVGSVATIGADLSTALQALGLLPYRKGETLRRVEAEIAAAREKGKAAEAERTGKRLKPKSARPVQAWSRPAGVQRPKREGIATYSNWAEVFAELASKVPCGETLVLGGARHSRSPDGSLIETTYGTTGKWRILKQTVTESDAATWKPVSANTTTTGRSERAGRKRQRYASRKPSAKSSATPRSRLHSPRCRRAWSLAWINSLGKTSCVNSSA